MSFWTRAKVFFTRKATLREQVERAYGLWLVATPRTTNAATFISNMTGIPRDQVWGILLGKKEE
jgi:hypothetical protein